MVICKFFQQGNCRYGNNCFNEHIYGGGGGGGGGGFQQQRKPLVQPSRFGGGGFGDSSRVTGGFSFTSALQSVQPPTNVFGGGSSPASTTARSIFGGSSSMTPAPTTGFSFTSALNQVQQTSPFGQPQQQTSPFGSSSLGGFGQPPAFGQTPFGQQSPPATAFGQPSAFGQPTSPFGQPQQPSSTFGSPATFSNPLSPQPLGSSFGAPSTFGVTPSSPPGGVFGQPSTFGQIASSPPAFGSFVQPAQQTTFGSSIFSQAAQTPTGFGFNQPQQQQQVSSPFGGQQASPFLQQQQPQPQVSAPATISASQLFNTPTRSLFSGGASTNTSGSRFAFGGDQQSESLPPDTYTPIDQLSPDDLAAFRAEKFEFGKIPLLPPPLELCG